MIHIFYIILQIIVLSIAYVYIQLLPSQVQFVELPSKKAIIEESDKNNVCESWLVENCIALFPEQGMYDKQNFNHCSKIKYVK